MNAIEKLLTGQLDMTEFIPLLRTDADLRQQLSDLIPDDAKEDPGHDLWKRYSYSALKMFGFDVTRLLENRHKFNGTIQDNLNIFGTIRTIYTFFYPEIVCTQKYHDAFDLYLDVVKDCYDGPEVKDVVEHIIHDALSLKTKKAKIAQAKSEIHTAFHVIDNKRPRWIQGPEWPMGEISPMAFVSQSRCGEYVNYVFEDVDTEVQRIITQYY